MTVVPFVVSTRYFDEKYTLNVALLTAAVYAVAGIARRFPPAMWRVGVLTNAKRRLCENNDAGLFVTCRAGVIPSRVNNPQDAEDLDERKRDIIILRFYSGKTLRDISVQTGIFYAYVKVLQNNAFAKIKKYFENQ